jgi:hypothetical protein
MKKIKDYSYIITLSEDGFESSVGRKPRNQDEFDEWGYYMKKGIDAQLDWDILENCAGEHFK